MTGLRRGTGSVWADTPSEIKRTNGSTWAGSPGSVLRRTNGSSWDELWRWPEDVSNLFTQVMSATSIRVSWLDVVGVTGPIQYRIRHRKVGDSWSTVTDTGTPKTFSGLGPNTTYEYQIRMEMVYDTITLVGDYSASEFDTTDEAVPTAPSGLAVSQVSGYETSRLKLDWTDNSDNETGFKLYRNTTNSQPGSPFHTTAANVETYTDTGLDDGERYYYWVEATNSAGDSSPDSDDEYTQNEAPTSFSATWDDVNTEVDLSWADNASNESGFKIERAPDVSGSPGTYALIHTTAAGATGYSDDTAVEGNTYHYRVRANGDATAANSDWATDSLLALAEPDAPTGLSATWDNPNAEVDLGWTDASDNESGFKIERAPDVSGSPGTWAQIDTAAANATSYSDDTVTVGNTYHYRVRAYNAKGNSLYSNEDDVLCESVPAAPSNLTCSWDDPTSSIDLAWTDNSSNEDHFRVERAPDSGGSPGTWGFLFNVAPAYASDGPFGETDDGDVYHYRVRAENAAGNSAFTSSCSETVQTIGA